MLTQHGSIKAEHVIVATHFPAFDRGFYFARMTTRRSYVLAVRLHGEPPPGMHISTADEFHSFRTQPNENGTLLFIGGEKHATGKGGDTGEHYRKLAAYARQQFDVKSFEYRWSTQDYQTKYRVPYVGKLSPRSKRLYVATGFGGWGMTNSTAAAAVLRDAVLGRKNAWSGVYDPARFKPMAFVLGLISGQKGNAPPEQKPVEESVSVGAASLAGLAPEEGSVIEVDKRKVAVYRDALGKCHALSAVCTHMGCTVAWNSAEKSWDCPCHGSRFDTTGKVIQTPAIHPLEKLRIDIAEAEPAEAGQREN